MIYTEKIQRAIKFAAKTHGVYQQQTRKGKAIPYICHPLTSGIILSLINAKEDVIVAGILHDTIEDSIEEKKVTKNMIAERFGSKVAELVMSVTEPSKKMSWEKRKKIALGHIKNYSQESLLVKSADVISNVSEIIDDYVRYQDEIFKRFSASKEKTIENYTNVIDAILKRWPKNPLAKDLAFLAKELGKI